MVNGYGYDISQQPQFHFLKYIYTGIPPFVYVATTVWYRYRKGGGEDELVAAKQGDEYGYLCNYYKYQSVYFVHYL